VEENKNKHTYIITYKMASNKRQINLVESSDIEFSIKSSSVQRSSSSSKVIVIDYDIIIIDDDDDKSLQKRNEGEINFAEEDGEDNGSHSSSSVQLVSRSISAAPVYVQFSNIRKSVQRSSSSKKIIVIDHDDNDESLQRNEGEFNFAEDGEDNGSHYSSVQLVSRSIIAAPAYVDEVKESESSEDDDKTLELKLEEDDDKTLELKLE
jgi:hypothetical protein